MRGWLKQPPFEKDSAAVAHLCRLWRGVTVGQSGEDAAVDAVCLRPVGIDGSGVRAEYLPPSRILVHFAKIALRAERDRAVMRGSVLPDASLISSSQPRSFTVMGVPKTSIMAFAAVTPTDCSRDRRIR